MRNIRVLSVAFILIWVTPQIPLSTYSGANAATDPDHIDSVIKVAGWEIPKAERASNAKTWNVRIDNRPAQRIEMLVDKEQRLQLEGFTLGKSTLEEKSSLTLTINTQFCSVKSVFAYERNAKRFAYEVLFVPLAVKDGIEIPAAAVYNVMFVDNDGDGRFEERYGAFKLKSVPSWVDR
ncbi:MAG: hypothetical protein K1X52_11255 [Pyrinomonadaceae bacterium]|nr:hypothetical protein [Pyrinomonadaceae bacterium]